MLYTNKILRDQNGHVIDAEENFSDAELYAAMKEKKAKLISNLKNEKVINPSVARNIDEAIDELKKCSSDCKTIGNVKYYYVFKKKLYFYIHKIIEGENTYIDSTRFYSASAVANRNMLNLLMDDDPLNGG